MMGNSHMSRDSQLAQDSLARRKWRTALVLASAALVLFIGFILRGWVLGR